MQSQGYVSRAAFKLLEIQEKHKIIPPGGGGCNAGPSSPLCSSLSWDTAHCAPSPPPRRRPQARCWTWGATPARGCRWPARLWARPRTAAWCLASTYRWGRRPACQAARTAHPRVASSLTAGCVRLWEQETKKPDKFCDGRVQIVHADATLLDAAFWVEHCPQVGAARSEPSACCCLLFVPQGGRQAPGSWRPTPRFRPDGQPAGL